MMVTWREVFWLVVLAFAAFVAGAGWWQQAHGAEALPGPIPAEVVRVVDGDTFRVRARIWPGHTVEVLVRLDGIDTPELRGRCEAEKAAAREARRVLGALVADREVSLTSVRLGKYAGRVVAQAWNGAGLNLAQAMIDQEMAHGRARTRELVRWRGVRT